VGNNDEIFLRAGARLTTRLPESRKPVPGKRHQTGGAESHGAVADPSGADLGSCSAPRWSRGY